MSSIKKAELKRKERLETKAKTATYNLTQAQLDALVEEAAAKIFERRLQEIKDKATDEAILTAMTLTLAIPIRVMKEKYWKKASKDKLAKFAEEMLDIFWDVQDGKIDFEELAEDLYRDAGIKFEEEEV